MKERGFTYVMVLAAIVIVGVLIGVAGATTWRSLQVDREAELLFRGKAYRKAIEGFYQSNGAYPRSLEDLLEDPRAPGKRYLRAIYADPMTKGDWTLVRASGGGISGVASASSAEPLKRANFPREFEKFSSAKAYSEWIFDYVPPQIVKPKPSGQQLAPNAPPLATPSTGAITSGMPKQ